MAQDRERRQRWDLGYISDPAHYVYVIMEASQPAGSLDANAGLDLHIGKELEWI